MLAARPRRTVGVRDIPLVLIAPRRVFARVEDVAAYGGPLIVLLTFVTLVGWATVQTGLIDREVDRRIDQQLAQIDAVQVNVVEASARSEQYADVRKQGEFDKLLTRMRVVGVEPLKALATALLLAACLYGVVALIGRKPEWHTLLTICVFAGFIELARLCVVLALMLHQGTLAVDTSAALLLRFVPNAATMPPTTIAAASGLLSAADPFRVWYWVVVALGLTATAQLPGWRAWTFCTLGWLVGAGVRCGLAVATVAPAAGSMGPG